MGDYKHPVRFWHQNHSHPEYPSGLIDGDLVVNDTGLIFYPYKKRLSPLVIHNDNIISTYTEVTRPEAAGTMIYDMAEFLSIVGTFGIVQPRWSHLSIKFKLVDYDKLCVVGFVVPLVTFIGRDWAEKVETMIWTSKRNTRNTRMG